MNNKITLEQKLKEIRDVIIKDLIKPGHKFGEFSRGSLFIIEEMLNDNDIDKTAIVQENKNYFK